MASGAARRDGPGRGGLPDRRGAHHEGLVASGRSCPRSARSHRGTAGNDGEPRAGDTQCEVKRLAGQWRTAYAIFQTGCCTAVKYSNRGDQPRPPPALIDRLTCPAGHSDHRAHSSGRRGHHPRSHPHASADAACSGRRPGSATEAGGGAARHTRAWSVDAPRRRV